MHDLLKELKAKVLTDPELLGLVDKLDVVISLLEAKNRSLEADSTDKLKKNTTLLEEKLRLTEENAELASRVRQIESAFEDEWKTHRMAIEVIKEKDRKIDRLQELYDSTMGQCESHRRRAEAAEKRAEAAEKESLMRELHPD